ncbi:hypothetical protein IIB97_01810 [Patescibacteria group bacterium]|nr:hypothetical protein [Patescibacteria group bacterium]
MELALDIGTENAIWSDQNFRDLVPQLQREKSFVIPKKYNLEGVIQMGIKENNITLVNPDETIEIVKQRGSLITILNNLKEKDESGIWKDYNTLKPNEFSIRVQSIFLVISAKNGNPQKSKELIEEIESKKKEFLGIAKINTSLGSIEVLIIAKDKKKITKNDIELALQKNSVYKRIVLFVSAGEINKKTEEFLNEYKNIIKFLNIQI